MTFSAYGADYENENVATEDAWQALDFIAPPAERPPVNTAAPPTTTDHRPDLVEAFLPHLPLLKKYLRRRVPASDLDDVLQDVLLSIIRRAESPISTTPTAATSATSRRVSMGRLMCRFVQSVA